MSYIFENATLLTYDLNKNYSRGENLLINATKNLKLNGVLYNRYTNSDGKGVKETYSGILNILNNNTGQYEEIIINNYHLGFGRIVNISFPTQNPVFVENYVYTIEVVETGNFKTLPTDRKYGSRLRLIDDKLLNISEDLNFNYLQNGKYSYDHNITIQYYNDNSDIISKSKDLATEIFNDSEVYLGLFGKYSGFYNNLLFKQNVIQENYDLINQSVSFQKSIEIDENYKNEYSLELKNSYILDDNGITTVTENGRLKGLENVNNFTVQNHLNDEISSSYNRCNSIARGAILKNTPTVLGVAFEKFNNFASYNITYTDNLNYQSEGLIHSYETQLDSGSDNIFTYDINGSIRLTNESMGQIYTGTSSGFANFKKIYDAQLQLSPSYNLINSSIDFNYLSDGTSELSLGKNFKYNIKKTSDPSILRNNQKLRTIETTSRNDNLSLMTKEYILPNKDNKNFYFSLGSGVEQSQLSTTSVSIKGALLRPTGRGTYIWNDEFIDAYLPQLKSRALSKVVGIGQDYIISSASLTYDSNLSYGLDLNILSVKPK